MEEEEEKQSKTLRFAGFLFTFTQSFLLLRPGNSRGGKEIFFEKKQREGNGFFIIVVGERLL